MTAPRLKKFWPLILAGTLLSASTTAVVYSPTLYRIFCAYTGYGGTVQRVRAPQAAAKDDARTITVQFDANVGSGLPWDFAPGQRSVTVKFGEPTKVYYRAKNNSDKTIVGRAVFNVTPYQAASYFFKIQCFCFTNERLGPGESADMPLVFYVDPQMLKDKDARAVTNITLSYTFYRQKDLSPAEVEAARDLSAGSREKDAALKTSDTARYLNDAPRQ